MQDTTNERAEFLAALTTAWLAFTHAKVLDDARIEVYWLALADLELADVKRSIGRAIRECRFFPTVAELRHLAGQQTPEQRAALAWECVRRVRLKGLFGARWLFVFDDPVITATVGNLGGARKFHTTSGDDFDVWLRKEFERVYQLLLHQVHPRDVLPLAGLERESQRYVNGAPEPHDPEVKVFNTRLPWALEREQLELPAVTGTRPVCNRTSEAPGGPRSIGGLLANLPENIVVHHKPDRAA